MTNKSVPYERYRNIIELAPDVIYTLSLSGEITSLSPSFERITGWKVKDWLGRNFQEIIHPEDLHVALKYFKRSFKKKINTAYELRVLAKNGRYLIGEFTSAPDVVEGKVVGQIGVARDVTTSKEEKKIFTHYANIIKSADAAVISRDLDGIILTWNKSAEEIFGYKEKEMIGKSFSLLLPPHYKNEIHMITRNMLKGRHMEDYETIRINKNGKSIPIVAKISPIIDENGKVVGTSVFDRDNTEKNREREREKYIAKISKILSSSLDYNRTLKRVARVLVPELADWSAVHILNSDTGKLEQLAVAHVDPKKVKWAHELQKKFAKEASESEQDKKNLENLKAGKSQFFPTFPDALLNKLVKRKEDRKIIKMIGLKSIITVPLMSGKKVIGSMTLVSTREDHLYDKTDLKFAQEIGKLAGQSVDNAMLYQESQSEIRKRRKIQEELFASREQLSAILANVADGISVYDENAKLVYVNDAVAIASGYNSAQHMLNAPLGWKNIFEATDENKNPIAVKDLPGRKAVQTKSEIREIVRSVNKKTGEVKWAVVSARPILDENGRLKGSVSITHDITERKELERSKDDFISIASHELKTPVTSIKGYIHLLKKDHQEYERSFTFLNRIDSQLNKLTELIEDLLNLSRSSAGKLDYKMNEFEISGLVKEVVSDMQAITASHEIVLKNGVDKKIIADRDRVSQVLINLITNAIKYSPDGEKIVVSLESKEGDAVEVAVRDFGIGIDLEEQDKIFDRFYRVKDNRGKTFPGLGIGLYLSAEIVARHNGKIWVTSKKGDGATFHFKLPTTQSAAENEMTLFSNGSEN